MSLLNQESFKTSSGYTFSAPKNGFGASEYTLAVICLDISSSVFRFKDELGKALKTAIESCKKSPRAANLMIRVVLFNSFVKEYHGFSFLNGLTDATYTNVFDDLGGGTALYEVGLEGLESIEAEASRLYDLDITSNAVLFAITDGEDTSGKVSATAVKNRLDALRENEKIAGITTVVVGVNDARMSGYLSAFKTETGFDEYKAIGDATPGNLAKLASFVSQSISSVSQNLAGGQSTGLKI